jgi:predicted Zn finger-like uncharacterized protein
MVIVCPTCANQHTIDSAHIGADGRRVRCAVCRTTWFVPPEHSRRAREVDPFEALMRGADAEKSDAAVLLDAPQVADVGERAPARQQSSEPKKSPGRSLGETLAAPFRALPSGVPSAVFGLAALATLIGVRASVVAAAPATAALYAKIGLAVNLRGLELKAVKSGLETTGAGRLLIVEGEIVNLTRGELAVPVLELAVRGADGQALYTWTSEAPRKTLGPAETASFRARLASPPAEGRQVLVRFASASEGQTAAEAH